MFGKLTPTQEHSVATVGGTDYEPTHYGMAEISVKNNEGNITTIPIPRALHFPTSPVNVVSIGEMSFYYGNGTCDEETFIKSTCNKSWFSWDHGKQKRTIFHSTSGLPEIIVNEKELEKRALAFYTKAKNFFCNLLPPKDLENNTILLTKNSSDLPELIDKSKK